MYILHVHVKRLSLKKSIIGSANIMQYVQKKFSCLFPISHWAAPIEMNEKKTTDATFSSIWQNRNGILLLKLFWPTVRKKMFWWSRKTFEIRGWKPRIFKIFEITWTIYSNSERSEQFLVTECFFNLFLEVSQIYKIRTIIIQIGKNFGIEKHAGKVRK